MFSLAIQRSHDLPLLLLGEPPKVTMKQGEDLLGLLVMKNCLSDYLQTRTAYSLHAKDLLCITS